MAKFYLKDFVDYNNIKSVKGVSWQIALDPEFLLIIDEVVDKRNDINVWYSPMRHIDGKGFYDEKTLIYVRVKVLVELNGEIFDSDWVEAKIDNNNIDERYLMYKGNIVSKIKVEGGTVSYLW